MASYQYFSALVAVVFFCLVVVLIRKDAIHMGSAVRWFVIAIVALVFGVNPTLVDQLAGYLGISYGPILPLLLVSVFLLVKALLADIERAKTQVKLDRLNQKLALMENAHLKEIKESLSEREPNPPK